MGRPSPPFRMPRLSSPFESLRGDYDAVVVGSGYGGGVAAARLARAGLSVCVLERGEELHPGEYPSNGGDAWRSFQVRGERVRLGRETALFDLRLGHGISVLVGCGLGGTSLINANVCLEPEPWVFDTWPPEIQRERDTLLADGLARARAMLRPRAFPGNPGDLRKLRQLELAALALGGKFEKPPLAVNFRTGRNPVGVQQVECRLCGDCVSGCNHGAKNTVLMNYLPYARKHGAAIFTEVRVDWVEQRGGRWLVRFRRVGSGEDIFPGPHRFVRAGLVVLAAGTLGSTEILLRSGKRGGLTHSRQLGRRFSGNGDALAFAYNCRDPVNGIGLGEERIADHEAVGPCITGLVDLRQDRGEQGMVIEDGSPPGALAGILPRFLAFMSVRGLLRPPERFDRVRARWRWFWNLRGKAYDEGAVRNTQTHLVMAHDGSGGGIELCGDRPVISLPAGGTEIFEHIDAVLRRAADSLRGKHIPNPLWDKLWSRVLRRFWYWLTRRYRPKGRGDRDLVTVHPLGGCAMGAHAGEGVVNHKHQVFRSDSGRDVYDSLYVCDGAVVPRSLGVNPLLTIAGLAERACHHLLADRRRQLVADFPAVPFPPEEKRPATLGLRFSERLAGHVHVHQQGESRALDYPDAERLGRQEGTRLSVVLDMEIDDVAAFVGDPLHEIRVSGVATVGGNAAMVIADSFARILTWSEEESNLRQMVYRLHLVTEEGARFRIEGEKVLREHWWPFPLLRETTVLCTRVYDPGGSEWARGIIRVGFLDFLKQFVTQRPVNARGFLDGLDARWRFNRFFIREVSGHANPILAPPTVVDRSARRPTRALRARLTEVCEVVTDDPDHVKVRLTRYRGGNRGPVLLSHGLGVSSRIFTIDTIQMNLVECLYGLGYDVWLLDYRGSTELPISLQFTADDVARYDYPAAVDEVLRRTGEPSLHFVVHCFGATTFFMSVLGRHLDPRKVRSAVASQIATHLITSLDTRLKAGLYLGEWFHWFGLRYLGAYTDNGATRVERAVNLLLRFLPMAREERCRGDVCHRISLLYSLLYEHDRLDRETHHRLSDMFGVANLRALRHLAEMSRQGRLVDAEGGDVYIPNMRRLSFPIRFLHGAENYCFKPVSTKITLALLQELQQGLSPAQRIPYDRIEIPGYGHIDCIFGKRAAVDVYPLIVDHLDRHGRPPPVPSGWSAAP